MRGRLEMRIVAVEILGPYLLRVVFADGSHARIDVGRELWGAMLDPLRDPGYFARGVFDPSAGTIIWPNGVGLSPEDLAMCAVTPPDKVATAIDPHYRAG